MPATPTCFYNDKAEKETSPTIHAGPNSLKCGGRRPCQWDARRWLELFLSNLSEYYRPTQNLEEAVFKQLCARASSRISSAWILTAHVDDAKGVFVVDGLFVQDLAAATTLFLFAMSTWTENSEYTGLWSENLDSPLKYHICFSPSPFHKILSHLSKKKPKSNCLHVMSVTMKWVWRVAWRVDISCLIGWKKSIISKHNMQTDCFT